MSTKRTMRAIRQQQLGGPDVLELVEVPRPAPAPTEVLVQVTAASVNPVDWKVRSRGGFLGEPPFTVGWDVAGVVEEVGFGVTRFAPGDRVFGMPRFPREAAAYAEYVTAPSRQLARIPAGLSDVEAAALPLAGLTAWQALVETAELQSGQHVVILGAAGGVGHLAVQIAKARGAYVIGTARAEKHGFLADLGADEAVDYLREAVSERVRDADVALDVVGGQGEEAVPALRDGGILVSLSSPSEGLRERAAGRVRVAAMLVEPDRSGLDALAELVARGALRPHVSQTFALADAGRAHEVSEAGRTQGKLVLTVASDLLV
jgi:NADPH:quinone reductase-like Zn-dependent oxidoreductase